VPSGGADYPAGSFPLDLWQSRWYASSFYIVVLTRDFDYEQPRVSLAFRGCPVIGGVAPYMATIILVTGGSRSGKSDYARVTAESLPGPRVFVATMPVIDGETSQRIQRHRQERAQSMWETLEEPLYIAKAVERSGKYRVVLIDCLTLWINNIVYYAGQEGTEIREETITDRANELMEACSAFQGTVILVTNEVGCGIVPEDPISRLYRDLVGRCNRLIADRADEVTLVSCGIPLHLKTRPSR
jgi:adenosylcobinamide kinase/adenosylcobinamide-phosphate guanylyltransferase